MLAKSLNIKSVDNSELFAEYFRQYTGLFHISYKRKKDYRDKEFVGEMLDKFTLLDKSIFDLACSEAMALHSSNIEHDELKKQQIKDIEYDLRFTVFKNTKRGRTTKRKLIEKLSQLKDGIGKQSAFGGKDLLREITKMLDKANKLLIQESKEQDEFIKNDLKEERIKLLEIHQDLLTEYRENRKIRDINLTGRANEYGNRKIDFYLPQGYIIFKPNKENHIRIDFKFNKNEQSLLAKLQFAADNCLQPLSVSLSKDRLTIKYDESILNNNHFKETECKAKVKESGYEFGSKESTKVFADAHVEHERRMLKGKLANRFAAIDFNPDYIGTVVGDVNLSDKSLFDIIDKQCFDLTKNSVKLGVSSDNPRQIYQNNHRENALCETIKQLFDTYTHYGVSSLYVEDFDFRPTSKETMLAYAEFNRKIKNIWHLDLILRLIIKHCNIRGIKLILVEPSYTSFVGNFIYRDYDPIAAARAIARKGIAKKFKIDWYPNFDEIVPEKLHYLSEYKGSRKGKTGWKQLYKFIFHAKTRYRNKSKRKYGLEYHYLHSALKSGVKVWRQKKLPAHVTESAECLQMFM